MSVDAGAAGTTEFVPSGTDIGACTGGVTMSGGATGGVGAGIGAAASGSFTIT